MTDSLKTICVKFYVNWPGFVEDMTKTFWRVFSRLTVYTLISLTIVPHGAI